MFPVFWLTCCKAISHHKSRCIHYLAVGTISSTWTQNTPTPYHTYPNPILYPILYPTHTLIHLTIHHTHPPLPYPTQPLHHTTPNSMTPLHHTTPKSMTPLPHTTSAFISRLYICLHLVTVTGKRPLFCVCSANEPRIHGPMVLFFQHNVLHSAALLSKEQENKRNGMIHQQITKHNNYCITSETSCVHNTIENTSLMLSIYCFQHNRTKGLWYCMFVFKVSVELLVPCILKLHHLI